MAITSMMPVDRIPVNARLRKLVIEYPESGEHFVSLHFQNGEINETVTVYSPDSIANVLELNEVLIGDIDVLDATPDQREGFRQKLLFETDKGEFEIWATKILVDRGG